MTKAIPRARQFSSSRLLQSLRPVQDLPSWDLRLFVDRAYGPALPARLPWESSNVPAACVKWFIHDGSASGGLKDGPAESSQLRATFWSDHESTMVPLELTSTSSRDNRSHDLSDSSSAFVRTYAPLKILLAHLGDQNVASISHSPGGQPQEQGHSIYLAQCELSSLPAEMQSDLPIPHLIKRSDKIKGDIYSSSLWLGRPPTYTPLHRDPNPNLFIQLAGQKIIRLYPPEVGNAIFQDIQQRLSVRRDCSTGSTGSTTTTTTTASASSVQHLRPPSSPSIRGEEMMQGPERDLFHRAIWGGDSGADPDPDTARYASIAQQYGQEAQLHLGQALFIPKGWWHSVKGVGLGVNASANWWFR